MEYREFQQMVQASTQRSLRYYACAVAMQIKDLGKSGSIVRAVALGEQLAMGKTRWATNYELRKLNEQLKSLASNQDNFQRRTAREVALLCVEPQIVKMHFMTVINAVRGFMGRHFDDEIHDCIRPSKLRLSSGSHRPHILAMAHKMFDEEDYAVGAVLADALEEANVFTQESWDHLRKDCHWRGCWVLDDIMGIWG